MTRWLELADEELAFFRLSCDLFPTSESPLRFLVDKDLEPEDPATTFQSLDARSLLSTDKTGAHRDVLDRIEVVADADARITMRSRRDTRDFYVSQRQSVEYLATAGVHRFGEPRAESALVADLAQRFRAAATPRMPTIHLNAGEYLVFALFARDVRQSHVSDESPMSVDEVLAYFDEPDTQSSRTPSDASWQQAVQRLSDAGVLVRTAKGYELNEAFHVLAREIIADHQHTVVRMDFLDDQWLVREVSLYPTEHGVFRLGSQPDGSVRLEELSATTLADILAGVITTLPNLLSADVSASLRTSVP